MTPLIFGKKPGQDTGISGELNPIKIQLYSFLKRNVFLIRFLGFKMSHPFIKSLTIAILICTPAAVISEFLVHIHIPQPTKPTPASAIGLADFSKFRNIVFSLYQVIKFEVNLKVLGVLGQRF
jgi:hypothetical protein